LRSFRMEKSIIPENPRGKLKVLLDTHIYDKIADKKIPSVLVKESLKTVDYYITHIQADEMNNCPDKRRCEQLQSAANSLKPIMVPTESFVEGLSKPGFSKPFRGKYLDRLRKRDKHVHDALIGEVAISKGLILVTDDRKLKDKVNENRGCAMSLKEFMRILENCP
jgi:hypothetical protein